MPIEAAFPGLGGFSEAVLGGGDFGTTPLAMLDLTHMTITPDSTMLVFLLGGVGVLIRMVWVSDTRQKTMAEDLHDIKGQVEKLSKGQTEHAERLARNEANIANIEKRLDSHRGQP